jgi:hypothetical protein
MTKRNSKALQGIAILLMFFHHFFLNAGIYTDEKFLTDNFLRFPEVTEHMAWAARCCVGLFAFLSGYGLYHLFRNKSSFGECLRESLLRILKLYGSLLLVIFIGVVLVRLLLGEPVYWSAFPKNLLAYDPSWNGSWWYVLEYVWMLLLAPVLWYLLQGSRGKGMKAAVIAVLLIVWAWFAGIIPVSGTVTFFVQEHVHLVFLYIFAEGYAAAALQNYSAFLNKKWDAVAAKGRPAVPTGSEKAVRQILRFLFGVLLIAVAVILRYVTTHEAGYAKIDVIVVPLLCWGFSVVFRYLGFLEIIFGFFGKHSLYMWLTQVLIFERTVFEIRWTGGPVVFYLTEVCMALCAAYILETIARIPGLFLRNLKKEENKKIS